MSTVTAPASATAASTRTRLVPPGRLGSWFAVLALPAWLGAFVTLFSGFGAKREMTAVEQAQVYHDSIGAAWAFVGVSVIALALLALAPALLAIGVARLRRFRPLAAIVVLLSAVTLGVELFIEGCGAASIAGSVETIPAWMLEVSSGSSDLNHTLNAIAWSAIGLAVPLVAFLLSRARVLGRPGFVIAIVGAAVFLVSVPFLFFQPMAPAALLLALGIPLLRHRK